MISAISSLVTPLSNARPRWPRSCSGRSEAIKAATTIRLRSRLLSPGRSHISPYMTDSESSIIRGTTARTASRDGLGLTAISCSCACGLATALTGCLSEILVPRPAVTLDQRNRGGGTPAAGGVGTGMIGTASPCLQYRLDPDPGGFDLIVTHEQRWVAADGVHQQALIGVREAHAEGLFEANIQSGGRQAQPAGTGILGHHFQSHALFRL